MGWLNRPSKNIDTALPQAAVTALYNETTTTATYDYVEYEGPNPNSIAYYKMSDATDQLGNYNGTATDVNFNTEGKFGFAGAFNGTSSKINTGYIQTGQVYSASFWGKGFSAGGSILRDTPAAGGANTFMDIATGANGQVIIGGNVALAPSYTPSTDWTHYAVVLDGTNATIYENGSQIATKTYTAKTGNNGTPVHMMSNGAYPAGFSGGYLDQVRIYDSALSAANVTTLYKEIECPAVAVTNAFNTVLYTGNGGTQAITGLGFQPDFVWMKSRSDVREHILCDSVRGVNKELSSDNTYFEESRGVNSFDANGFTLDGLSSNYNGNNLTYVAWNWKAGGAAVSNTDGTITSQVSANTDAGFSIVSYTGNGTAGTTFGHGLNQAPELIIPKNRDEAQSWPVSADAIGKSNILTLDNASATLSRPNQYYYSWDSSTITTGSDIHTNGLNDEIVAYCFHSVPGYSKIGSYVGNRPTDVVIYTGFAPRFVMIKCDASGESWTILDSARGDNLLHPDTSGAEQSYTGVSLTSTGFTVHNSGLSNTNGATHIYLAIA